MKFLVNTILIGLLSIAAGMFLPWWSIALVAFLVNWALPLNSLYAFLSGFIGIFIGWGLLAVIRDSANDGILSSKIAHILPLGGSSLALLLLSSFIGALVGGLAALTASFIIPSGRSIGEGRISTKEK